MTDKQTRLKPEARREDILAAAFHLATKRHYQLLTRNEIAEQAGISGPSVQYHFGTMARLRKAIVRAAICRECLAVLSQAILSHDPLVKGISPELRERAVASVS